MKVLVTGGNGFIGSFLIEALLKKGHEIRCLIRKNSNLRWIENLPVEFVTGDINSPETLPSIVRGRDWVFHLGGVTRARSEAGYLKVNATGTENLLRACRENNPLMKKFVLVSSLAAAGPTIPETPLTEIMPPVPISAYGKSKAEAERIALHYSNDFPVAIVRPPAVYGPRDVDVFEIFRYVKFRIKPQIAGPKKFTSIIYIQDLVDGLILTAENGKTDGQIYFLTGDGYFTWQEIFSRVEVAMGNRAIPIPIPAKLIRPVAAASEFFARFSQRPPLLNRDKVLEMEQPAWICENQKAKSELGFQPKISLTEGCKLAVMWYREQGWL